MRSATRLMGAVVGVLTALEAAPVGAAVTSWTFQQVAEGYVPSPGHLALTMRTGATWPVVLADDPPMHNNQLMGFGLTPAGWISSTVGSHDAGYGSYVRAKTGSDGRVAVTWQSGNQIMFAQAKGPVWQTAQVASGLYSSLSSTAPDVDYLSADRPVVGWSDQNTIRIAAHDGLTWNQDTVSFTPGGQVPCNGGFVSVATDSQDNIGVAYANGGSVYFAYRSLGGDAWAGATVLLNGQGSVRHLSLAFGPNDEPGLCILDSNGNLSFASYDIQQGAWQAEQITYGVTSGRVNLVFNSLGQPATAVLTGPIVSYVVNDGSGWQWSSLPTGYDANSRMTVTPMARGFGVDEVALAFDANDLPVIAYYSTDPGLLLAYDPIVVPEPATLMALVAAIGLRGLRRRSR